MHLSFLPCLVDPISHSPLQIKVTKRRGSFIDEGSLIGRKSIYPIVHGIPRFSGYQDDKKYADSFSYQWNRWGLIQFERFNKGYPMEGHTRTIWERVTGVTGSLTGKTVVDWGCGTGRFIEIAREKKAKVIGIDLSYSVEIAQQQFADDPNVLIIQGDILNSPIAHSTADLGYSIGVLHHTPNPKQGFHELVKMIKPKGRVAVSVYGTSGHYVNPVVNMYRQVFKYLWPVLKHYPPLIYSYSVVYGINPIKKLPILRNLMWPLFSMFPSIDLPDPRWSVLDTFDSVTPTYQKGLSLYEVFDWFKSNKLSEIEPADWKGTCLRAYKK